MRALIALAAIVVCATSPARGEAISRVSLAQLQDTEGAKDCSANLKEGIQVTFTNLAANEGDNNVVIHEIALVTIPTTKEFPNSAVVTLRLYDKVWWAKILQMMDGKVKFGVDAEFVNFFWGS